MVEEMGVLDGGILSKPSNFLSRPGTSQRADTLQ
jgi:hypothetical protein